MKNKTINISQEFSKYPGPRYKKLGLFSGEEFRDDILIPALKVSETVTIQLDGAMGYGSSFLEETFGGAVRNGWAINRDNLKLESEDEELLKEIWDYIESAQSARSAQSVVR